MALIPGTLPSDTCYGTPQDLLELFAQYLDIPAVALQSKVFFDSVAPSDTESIWIDDTTALNPIMKLYVGGSWVEYPLVGTATTANQLVDGKATVTTPASGDFLLISQSGILKKITYGNLVPTIPTNKAFFFTKSTTQTVTTLTETKCTFDTTVFNQGSIITLASSTFTPTVAGYYYIQGQIYAPQGGSGYTTKVTLRKNGSPLLLGVYSSSGANTGIPSVTMVSGVVYFNGTSDTFELYGKTDYTIWAVGGNDTYTGQYVGDNPTYGTYLCGYYLGV